VTREIDNDYAKRTLLMANVGKYDWTGKRNIEQDTAEPGERVATV
jgi:hypothetical protein